MNRWLHTFVTVSLMGALAVGCASDKAPAEAAIKSAETAFAAVKTEAAQYVPEQTASVEAALTAATEKLGKSDYKGALADAQAAGSKIQELPAAAAAKKAELTKAWESLSA